MMSETFKLRFIAALLALFATAAHAQGTAQPAFQSPPPPSGKLDTRFSAPSKVIPVDRIVAVVNDEVITGAGSVSSNDCSPRAVRERKKSRQTRATTVVNQALRF